TLGTVGIDWLVAGFGDFNGDGTTDMVLRNATSGTFQLYNINNNAITSTFTLGTVGIDWLVAGFGNVTNHPRATDMILRNATTGALEVYDIRPTPLSSAFTLGTVGIDWLVAGFGPISGPGKSDMVLRNARTGAFEVYDIANNQITAAAPLGSVGLDWLPVGIAPNGSSTSALPAGNSTRTAQLTQAMAAFGGGSAAESLNAAPFGAETAQQPLLTAPQHA